MLHRFKIRKNKSVIKPYLLILLFLPLLAFKLHKEYYSLTNIQYDEASKSFQITSRVFADDFDLALSQYFEQNLEIGTAREVKNTDELIEKYLIKHFQIELNDSNYTYKFLGKETEKDVIYLYMEIKDTPDSIESIKIKNTILQTAFPEQENIHKIRYKGFYKSLILTKENPSGLLNFS